MNKRLHYLKQQNELYVRKMLGQPDQEITA